jgi:hypothetical protein
MQAVSYNVYIDTCMDTFLHIYIYSRTSTVRGQRARGYLELPKSSDYAGYDNLKHMMCELY